MTQETSIGLSSDVAPWRPILIIVPNILIETKTWQSDMEKFFKPGIFDPILVLDSNEARKLRRKDIAGKEYVLAKPVIDATAFTKYRIVITNYDTVVNYQHSFAQLLPDKRSIWSVMVTDEAQEYKSPNTNVSSAIKAVHPDVFITNTGTPIENRLLDLWNLIDAIQCGFLGTQKEFSKAYEADSAPLADRLTLLRDRLFYGQAKAFVLRRDKSDAIELPAKHEHVIECQMTAFEIDMHMQFLQAAKNGRHLAAIHKLVAMYQHPQLLRRSNGLNPATLLAESSKLRGVLDVLDQIKAKREKVVIFAHFKEMQQILAAVITDRYRLTVDIVNGTPKPAGAAGSSGTRRTNEVRKSMLDRFRQKAGFNVIVLSPKVAGIGLPIVEANHVIHYGRWWNPAVESQATDRVYRIGQEKEVHVYLPILKDPTRQVKDSFDEKLDELLRFKYQQARDFLVPVPNDDDLAEELFRSLSSNGSHARGDSASLLDDDVDRLDSHLFESLIACLLEREGGQTVLTARGNDGGADVLSLCDGTLSIIQVKHSRSGACVTGTAVDDLIGASINYNAALRYSVQMLAVTNGEFSRDIRREAQREGIKLIERAELMRQLREHPLGRGEVLLRDSARCKNFQDGIRQAADWLR